MAEPWLEETFPTFAALWRGILRVLKWRGWRYVGIAVAALGIVGIVVHAAVTAWLGWRVARELEALRQAGFIRPYQEIMAESHKPVAGPNAADLYVRAGEILWQRWEKRGFDYGEVRWWTREGMRRLQKMVREDRDVLELVRRATAMPQCRFQLEWTQRHGPMVMYGNPVGRVARFLVRAARVAAWEGRAGEAAECLRMSAVLAKRVATCTAPVLIDQLMAYRLSSMTVDAASFCLSHGGFPLEASRRLAEALAEAPEWRGLLVKATVNDFSMLLSIYDVLRRDWHFMSEIRTNMRPRYPLERVVSWVEARIMLPLTYWDELFMLRHARAKAEMMGRRAVEVLDGLTAWHERVRNAPPIAGMLLSLFPAVVKRDFVAARQAQAAIAVGLEAFRRAHGRYPKSLDELAEAGWPCPADPITGGRFVYRPEGDGFVLYSIGFDGRDDGGQVNGMVRLIGPRWREVLGISGRQVKPGLYPPDGDLPWLKWPEGVP